MASLDLSKYKKSTITSDTSSKQKTSSASSSKGGNKTKATTLSEKKNESGKESTSSSKQSTTSTEKKGSGSNVHFDTSKLKRSDTSISSFRLGKNIYKKNYDGSYSKAKAFETQSDKDKASVSKTGHETILTDLGQAIEGGAKSWLSSQMSTRTTVGLAYNALKNKDNYYQPQVGSKLWKLTNASHANTEEANELLENSKEGRGLVGRVVMDVASQAVENGIDAAIKSIPGVGQVAGTISFASRAFGASAQAARDEGKSIATQVVSGAVSATVEAITESMWSYGGVRSYGFGSRMGNNTGVLGRLTTNLEASIAEKCSPVVAKLVMSFGTEAIEEMLADLINPAASALIRSVADDDGWLGDYEGEHWQGFGNMFYDGLIGGLSGIGGGIFEAAQIAGSTNTSEGKASYITALRNEAEQAKAVRGVAKGIHNASLVNVMDTLLNNRTGKTATELASEIFGSYVSTKNAYKMLGEQSETFQKICNEVAEKFSEKSFANEEVSKDVLKKACYKFLVNGEFATELEGIEDAKTQIASLAKDVINAYAEERVNNAKTKKQKAEAVFYNRMLNSWFGTSEDLRESLNRIEVTRQNARLFGDEVEDDETIDKTKARYIGYGLDEEENAKATESVKANDEARAKEQAEKAKKDEVYARVFRREALKWAKANNIEAYNSLKALDENARAEDVQRLYDSIEYQYVRRNLEKEAKRFNNRRILTREQAQTADELGISRREYGRILDELDGTTQASQEEASAEEVTENGTEEVRNDVERRTDSEVRSGGEQSESAGSAETVSTDEHANESGRNSARESKRESEPYWLRTGRVAEAVKAAIAKKFGAIESGEVDEAKVAKRLHNAYALMKRAGISQKKADMMFDTLLLDFFKKYYDIMSQGEIKAKVNSNPDYYRGLVSTEVLAMIAEGNMPSLLQTFQRTAEYTEKINLNEESRNRLAESVMPTIENKKEYSVEQAEKNFKTLRNILKSEGYFTESNVENSEARGKYNAYAQTSAADIDDSGKNNKTAVLNENNAEVGDADTVIRGGELYKKQDGDFIIHVDNGENTGNRRNRLKRENRTFDIVKRNETTYFVINDKGIIVGAAYDDFNKALAAARGTSEVYGEMRFSLRDSFVNSEGKLDIAKIFSTALLASQQSKETKNQILRVINRSRSQASDLQGVQYSTYGDTRITTTSMTVDLNKLNLDSSAVQAFLSQVIMVTANGGGIVGTNGKTYVFAGQTASQRKEGIIQLMEKKTYDKCVDYMNSALNEKERGDMNIAKYLANIGTLFTPSNNDTGVKIRDCAIMYDFNAVIKNVFGTTLNYVMTDDTNDFAKDKAEIRDILEKKFSSDGYEGKELQEKVDAELERITKNCKVGKAVKVMWDGLNYKGTDGLGFVMSDKQSSFQMRSVGGIKGLLVGFNWVKFLQDNMPTDTKVTDGDKTYFERTADGDIYAYDVFGHKHNIKDLKGILFESTVKFSGQYAAMSDGYEKFYSRLGDQDIRSIPRENVYGVNANSGMVDAMTRRGLAQMLRNKWNFSDEDIEKISNRYLWSIVEDIVKDPQKIGKMFGVDFTKVASTTTDIEAAVISLFGEGFVDTRAGRKWTSNKLKLIAEDYLSGKIITPDGEAKFGWIAPDVIGLFNKIANVNMHGYAGLEAGEIMNAQLAADTADSRTIVGRWPSIETNDLQLRRNVRNAQYQELIEKYGLDDRVTYFALGDQLGLHLDNDFDGDTGLFIQGVLAKMLYDTRKSNMGKYSTFTLFRHSDGDSVSAVSANAIINVIRAGMNAENIGMFDNAIDILDALSAKELRVGRLKYEKDTGERFEGETEKEKDEAFRDALTAQFAVAYKLNFDFAKYQYYPDAFKAVVDDTLNMLDDILAENKYTVAWADEYGNATTRDKAAKLNGRLKKVFEAPRVVPASWKNSDNTNKNRAYEIAFAAQKAGKGKFILEDGEGVTSKLSRAFTDDTANAKITKAVSDATQSRRGSKRYSYDVLSTYNVKDATGNLLLRYKKLETLASEVLRTANREYLEETEDGEYRLKSGTREEMQKSRINAQKILYLFGKALGFNADQFNTFFIGALSLNSDYESISTFLNLDQSRWDKSLKGKATKDILLRNANIQAVINSYNRLKTELLPSLIKDFRELDVARETARARNKITAEANAEINRVISDYEARLTAVVKKINEAESLKREYLASKEEAIENGEDTYRIDAKLNELTEALEYGEIRYAQISEDIASLQDEKSETTLRVIAERVAEKTKEIREYAEGLGQSIDDLADMLERNVNIYDAATAKADMLGINADGEAVSDEFIDAFKASVLAQHMDELDEVMQEFVPTEDDDVKPSAEFAPTAENIKKFLERITGETIETEETETEAEASAAEAEEATDSYTANWRRAVKLYEGYHYLVSNAAERITKLKVAIKQTEDKIANIIKAVTNLNNGVSVDFAELSEAYDALKGTRYYNEKISEDIKNAKFIGPATQANAETVARIANEIYADVKAKDSIAKDSLEMEEGIAEGSKSAKQGKMLKRALRWQLNTPTMLKFLFGFKKGSLGYRLAENVEVALKTQMTLLSKSNSFFNQIMRHQNYKKFYEGETKLSEVMDTESKDAKNIEKFFGSEFKNLSLIDAAYVLEVYDEISALTKNDIKEDPNSPYYKASYIDGLVTPSGKVVNINYEFATNAKGEQYKTYSYESGYESLRKVLKTSDVTNGYMSAMYDMLDSVGKLAYQTAKRVYGYAPEYYKTGRLLPIKFVDVDEHGNVKESADISETWNGDTAITDPRMTLEYGKDKKHYIQIVSLGKAVNTYVDKMSDFIAYKELRSYLEAINTKTTDADSFANIVGRNYGAELGKWVNNYVADMTMHRQNDSLAKDIRIALQKGTLIGNPSTIMKQSSSYWSALGVLSFKSLARAYGMRYTHMQAGKTTDVMRYRLMKNAMSPELQEILGDDNAIDKFMNKVPGYKFMKKGITWMDTVTVNNLFTATVFECIDNHIDDASYDFNSKDFYNEIENKFEEVVIYTQPMFANVLRAEYGRTQNEFVRMISMFRTQQTQNFNRLVLTLGEYHAAKEAGEDTTEYKKAVVKTVEGHAIAALSLAVLKTFADLVMHKWKKFRDDDDEFDWTKVLERIGLDTFESAAGVVWFGDEAAKLMADALSGGNTSESYGISTGIITALNNASSALTSFTSKPSLSSARYAAGYIAQLMGIPLNNAYKYLNTFAMWYAEVTGQNPKEYDDIIQLVENNNKIDKNLKPAQAALVDLGMSKKEAANYLKAIDENDNGKLSQDEIKKLYYDHPESAGILQALWDMQDWSTDFDDMTKAVDKKRTYYSNPLYAEMDTDESESVSKEELVEYYIAHPEAYDELEKIYEEQGWKGKFSKTAESADKKRIYRSNPLYAEMDEDESESVSKKELLNWYLENEDAYDIAKSMYETLGFSGKFDKAVEDAQDAQLKEEATEAYETGDYNALFDAVTQMKNGKSWLTSRLKEDSGDDYTTTTNLLLNYITGSGVSAFTADSVVSSLGSEKLVSQYKTLRSSGLSPKQAAYKLDIFDSNDNGSITQAELAEYYKSHKDEEAIIKEFWSACGWKKTWAEYKKAKKIA